MENKNKILSFQELPQSIISALRVQYEEYLDSCVDEDTECAGDLPTFEQFANDKEDSYEIINDKIYQVNRLYGCANVWNPNLNEWEVVYWDLFISLQ
jgi:hypothetical protein